MSQATMISATTLAAADETAAPAPVLITEQEVLLGTRVAVSPPTVSIATCCSSPSHRMARRTRLSVCSDTDTP